VPPFDAPTYAGVTVLIALVTTLATLAPARRAARVSLVEALTRSE
jgi:ABC-type lipoprotein release transport system permease subunit